MFINVTKYYFFTFNINRVLKVASLVVGCRYEKKHRTGNKLQQKVSQHILVVLSVLYNILKVYQSLTTRNAIFRPQAPWAPKGIF